MIYLPIGKGSFKENVEIHFPKSFCCNCGERYNLRCVEQDTRVTTYLFGGGTEIIFKFLLPFCIGCLPSSKRRPKNIFHMALLFVMVCAIIASTLVGIGLFVDTFLSPDNIILASLLISFFFVAMKLVFCRPKDKQTSYFQPVIVKKLKREFISTAITKITFLFTNKEYARAFSIENKKVILDGIVEVKCS